jgi:ribosomal protein S18 acetylase RimI-like enzyme
LSEPNRNSATASTLTIRDALPSDEKTIWRILRPVIGCGDTYALPRTWTAREALAYWFLPSHQVRVAVTDGDIVGTYYLMANQLGGGDHVANCGYVTDASASGGGVATAMCLDSMKVARTRGFQAMQFNFVLESNVRAIALWERLGFKEIGRIPDGFRHPSNGLIDALVMWRSLENIEGDPGLKWE